MFRNDIKQQYLLYDNLKIKPILSKRMQQVQIKYEKDLKSEDINHLFNNNCISVKAQHLKITWNLIYSYMLAAWKYDSYLIKEQSTALNSMRNILQMHYKL